MCVAHKQEVGVGGFVKYAFWREQMKETKKSETTGGDQTKPNQGRVRPCWKKGWSPWQLHSLGDHWPKQCVSQTLSSKSLQGLKMTHNNTHTHTNARMLCTYTHSYTNSWHTLLYTGIFPLDMHTNTHNSTSVVLKVWSADHWWSANAP